MASSLLARLRGGDARSLARALVLLLAISWILGAFHSGSMAGAGWDASLICGADGATIRVGDQAPTPEDGVSCCSFGCGPQQPQAAAPDEAVLVAAVRAERPSEPPQVAAAKMLRRDGSSGPRGPPVLA